MVRGRIKIVLIGYNGANNTGSEARLLKVVDDLRAVCGPNVHITVPSLNVRNLRRYLKDQEDLRVVAIPAIYYFTLRRLVKENDVMMLVEGSCYMDTWTSTLLNAYLWCSRFAKRFDKDSIAYAIDAGQVKPGNVKKVRRHASKTDLIIVRTRNAGRRLKEWGVTAPIEVTADTAFDFDLTEPLSEREPSGKVGMALVDFYLWPVVFRPWGRRADCYRWPYYYSRSSERCKAREDLVREYAALADDLAERRGKEVVLISMEALDEPLVLDVLRSMRHAERAKVISSRELNAHQMTKELRELDALLTSRYHAAVLSMAAAVPMLAIGHDKRLEDLFEEIGIKDELFISASGGIDWSGVRGRMDTVLDEGERIKAKVKEGFDDQIRRMARNRLLLREFLTSRGWLG